MVHYIEDAADKFNLDQDIYNRCKTELDENLAKLPEFKHTTIVVEVVNS